MELDGKKSRMMMKHAIAATLGLLGLFGAAAAQANETATAVQISSAVNTDSRASGDGEFRELFASWKDMDNKASGVAPAPRASVSIPSGMPVGGVRLTSSYGMRNHPILQTRRAHTGIDLAGPTGTPVYATADGYVSKAETYSSYGKFISLDHGGELETRYAHLSGYAVSAGDRVTKGQLIGYIGSTGRSTGPHLHYEVRVAGQAVDPTPYMTGAHLASN